MAIATINAGSRRITVTTTNPSPTTTGYPYIELGPAGTTTFVSTMMIQFNPNVTFTGNFIILGRLLGQAAQEADTPFVPISYRRWSLNDVASDYTIVSDPITGPALIEVPANGLSIVVLDGLDTGSMDILSWDVQGNSAV